MARVASAGESATLSRNLSDFLIEFSIGMQKYAIYPKGHPMLGTTSVDLKRRLETLLRDRPSLSLGVARNQLIIEGVATDEANPVLRELAARLHRHHLGAVKFSQGITDTELNDMLATVAVDAGRLPRPLGLEGPEVLTQWPHTRLYPMTFAQLQLIEEGPSGPRENDDQMKSTGAGSRSAQLWIGLARAALINELGSTMDSEAAESTDPATVAKAIEEHKRDEAYDQVVVGYLLQIAEEMKAKGGRDAAALTKRVSQLVSTLSPEALRRLLQMGGDVRQRRKFVADAAQGMAVEAVVDLVQVAAETSGQNISHSMVRMLSKMAVHADTGTTERRTQADGALREQVAQLIAGWALDDPNPDGYRLALEKMAHAAPTFRSTEHTFPVEPERLLTMGFEIETLGDQVFRSVDALAARDDLTPLVEIVDGAPAEWMRDAVWRHVATPQRLRLQLALDPPPTAMLQRLVARMGAAAVEALLDALDESEDERAQERIVELLASVGPAAGPLTLQRLPGMRWAHVRLLIALLGKQQEWPGGYSAALFVNHPDPQVRREALRQQLRAPETRDDAIVRALADASDSTLRLGLGAAMTSCPRDAAAILRVRADDATLSPDLRALGIRALASYKAPETPAWLAERVVRVGRVLRRPGLAPKSPELLAAIEGLATHWREDKAANEALALAAASGDPEIQGAATPRGTTA